MGAWFLCQPFQLGGDLFHQQSLGALNQGMIVGVYGKQLEEKHTCEYVTIGPDRRTILGVSTDEVLQKGRLPYLIR